MNYLLYLLLAFVASVIALQIFAWRRAKRAEGRAAPPSSAGPGRRLYYFFSPHCGPAGR